MALNILRTIIRIIIRDRLLCPQLKYCCFITEIAPPRRCASLVTSISCFCDPSRHHRIQTTACWCEHAVPRHDPRARPRPRSTSPPITHYSTQLNVMICSTTRDLFYHTSFLSTNQKHEQRILRTPQGSWKTARAAHPQGGRGGQQTLHQQRALRRQCVEERQQKHGLGHRTKQPRRTARKSAGNPEETPRGVCQGHARFETKTHPCHRKWRERSDACRGH